MHLVVDDQAPVLETEEIEMDEILLPLFPVRQDLVSRDRYRLDVFDLTAVLPDAVVLQIGLIEEFIAPLAQRRDPGRRLRRYRGLESDHSTALDLRPADDHDTDGHLLRSF